MAEILITVMVEGSPKQHGFAPSSTGVIPVSQLENRFPGAYSLTYDREGMEVMISESLGYLQAPKGGWNEKVTSRDPVCFVQRYAQFRTESGETYTEMYGGMCEP